MDENPPISSQLRLFCFCSVLASIQRVPLFKSVLFDRGHTKIKPARYEVGALSASHIAFFAKLSFGRKSFISPQLSEAVFLFIFLSSKYTVGIHPDLRSPKIRAFGI